MDEDDSDGEDDSEVKFVVASQVDAGKATKMDKAVSRSQHAPCFPLIYIQYLKRKKAALAALGQWNHINCLRPGAKNSIRDEILHHLLYTPGTTEQSQRTPPPTGSRVLDALGRDNVLNERGYLPGNVPGGTLSFLFERGSSMFQDKDDPVSESET